MGRRLRGLLAGDYRSNDQGEGIELAQLRPYQPGDDVRSIEWNVTARTRIPHVRVNLAERALVTWLLLDTSASMQFGTAERRKADVADGVALAVAHVATRRGNRLAVSTFGDDDPVDLPPHQGRTGLVGLLSALQREPTHEGGGPTSLDNLVQLCSYHHRLVHEGGFSVSRAGPDRLRFKRPDGTVVPARAPCAKVAGATIERRNRDRGLVIDDRTCKPRSLGQPVDYGLAVEVLCARALKPG